MIKRKLIQTETGTIEWINTISLSSDDKAILNGEDDLSREFLEYAVDMDESARAEHDDDNDTRLLSFDVPYFDSEANSYTTRPFLFIIRENKIYTFIDEQRDFSQLNHLLNRSFKAGTYESVYHLLFSVLYNFSLLYHEKLRILHKESDNVERAFRKNSDNNEIYRLMNVEKGLVYLSTSLKANKIALSTLRRRWGYGVTAFSDRETEKLEDVIVELEQGIEVSEINMTLVEREKSTYSTIIDNNLNSTMKFLTVCTVLITVPSIIYSFFGINTRIPFQDDPNGWIYVVIISLILCGIMATVFWKMKLFK